MKFVFFFWCFLSFFHSTAQSDYNVGVMPDGNFKITLKNDFALNVQTEFRFTDRFYFNRNASAVMLSKKIGVNKSIQSGYQVIINNETRHRFRQAFTTINEFDGFKIAQRISLDQTVANNESTELRFRYRTTGQFALNGLKIDNKEKYVKINTELLNNFQGENYDLEFRVVPRLGFQFTDQNKLEIGPDVRWRSILQNAESNSIWLSASWYLTQ